METGFSITPYSNGITKTAVGEIDQYHDQQGRLHRCDGPAFVEKGGLETWYFQGKIHRTDGPAVLRSGARPEWWVCGVRFSFKRWCSYVGASEAMITKLMIEYPDTKHSEV